MVLDIILLILGFYILMKGADFLVDGSSSLAKKLGLSTLMIGLTIVALGASMPELIVNIIASVNNNPDISIGNILGSNIANILLILGISSLFADLKVKKSIVNLQIPFLVLSTLALFFLTNNTLINGTGDNVLSRSGGLILILFFLIFLYYSFSIAKEDEVKEEERQVKKIKTLNSIFFIVVGSALLFIGGKLVVEKASLIASFLGFSEAFIGLTIVALGTSLPELITSVSAIRRNEAELALGNIVGSNVFNILFILGLSAIISPLKFNLFLNFDILFLILVSILLIVLIYLGKKLYSTKKKGWILILLYALYIVIITIRG